MSGGSQHNPNGRQSQLGSGWSPLQLQVANFLARAPQAHMASERGVTWHTPTPPPHLYHVPAPSPPDPLQAMKAAGNSVFRHTATPPELYRHTPTPPDKHLMRHTPSPGDVKSTAALPPAELYPHLGPGRDKLVRPEDLLAYARAAGGGGGVDLSLGSARAANGAPAPHASPALSVRDAPTINSLIARAQPRHAHTRVDALLERLVPSPVSPHSVIMHSRAAHTPSPPSSNEDSADSCGAPPGSKRKRKPERTIRVPSVPPPPPAPPAAPAAPARLTPPQSSVGVMRTPTPVENGDTTHEKQNGPEEPKIIPPKPETSDKEVMEKPQKPPTPEQTEPHARRKTRSGSAETIDDIAAMIADTDQKTTPIELEKPAIPAVDETDIPVTIDKLKSVLASPDSKIEKQDQINEEPKHSPKVEEKEIVEPETLVEAAAAPKRVTATVSNAESTNVPVESPSEAKPAEPEASEARTAEPSASFVEVENQLEKMFAGLEEEPTNCDNLAKPNKRRRSAPTKENKPNRGSRTKSDERRKVGRKKGKGKKAKKDATIKDAYDSGSNASSSRSRGPYIQIRGPRDSPLSVSVVNASSAPGDEETEAATATLRRKAPLEFRNGLRGRGLHASTLGLRYDATTPDATWLCAFCERGPHAHALGDLFGPYTAELDCDEYRMLDEATRRRYEALPSPTEVWFHEECAVWAPGLVAAGARLWGLAAAVWGARGAKCGACGKLGAGVACSSRGCRARTHVPCAAAAQWILNSEEFRATCPHHAPA